MMTRIAIVALVVILMQAVSRAEALGPFASMPEALVAAREHRRARPAAATQPLTLTLHGGTTFLTEPIVLTPDDSHLTIEAAPGEMPILSGGRAITGWRQGSFGGRDCWVADVPGVKEGKWYFRELWVNDARAVRARQPNKGFFHVKESPYATGNWEGGQHRFRYDGEDIPPGPYPYGAEAVVMCRWVESRLPLKSNDIARKIAEFTRKSQWVIQVNDPYWLEGDGRWLDQAGEWYLDRGEGRLYYLPRPGESIETIRAVAPVLDHVLALQGDVEHKRFITDLTLRGLSVAHTHWMLPDPDPATTQPVSGGYSQADLNVPAAVRGQGLRNVTIDHCTFRNLGTYALELGRSTQRSRVTNCTFEDLGAGGVRLGDSAIRAGNEEKSFGNEVSDCTISNCGNTYPAAVGIWVGQAYDNCIAHNEIRDVYYSGISVGWSWGYGDSLNRGNVIEYNHVHHIGRRSGDDGPILSDMGGIYTLGARQGTIIRNNIFHDVAGNKYGGWGIYLDEGSSDVLVEGNLVYNTTHGAFHLHYGADNLVTGNVFALGRDNQVQRTRQEEHPSVTFDGNVIYWTGESPLLPAAGKNMTFRRNVYGPLTPAQFRAGNLTWEQWRKEGQDEGTVFVGNIFADPAQGNFRPGPGERPEKLSIPKVPTTGEVGPRR